METFGMPSPDTGENESLESDFEKGIQALSGPLPERLGMLFTAEQMKGLEHDLALVGISMETMNGADEDTAREVAFILQNYFELDNAHKKAEVLQEVRSLL